MANKNRDPQREAFWRRAVARQRNGGHSIRAFCRSQRLSEPSFYAWRREIARRDKEERPGRTRPASVNGRQPRHAAPRKRPARRSAPPAFLPVLLGGDRPHAPAGIVIELRGGRRLRLPESMPAARLAELLLALEGAPALNSSSREAQP